MTPSPHQEDRYDTLTSAGRQVGHPHLSERRSWTHTQAGKKGVRPSPEKEAGMRLSPQPEDENETLNPSRKTGNRPSPYLEVRYETLTLSGTRV
jgi:hypothetical protein